MHGLPGATARPAAADRPRSALAGDPETELITRRLARGLSDVPIGRLSVQGCQDGSREDIVRRSAKLVRDWLMNGHEPTGDALSELYEAARSAARHGLAAEDTFRACCGAARAVWGTLLESGTAEDRGSLIPLADTVWAFIDVALTTVTRAFADQQDLPSASENSRATTLFARICAQSPPTIEDLDRAERLGFPLAGPHCPFVAAIADGSAAAHANMAARVRAAGALACAEGHRVAGLTRPGFDWMTFLADSALVLAAQPATSRAGLADAVSNLHDLVTLAERAGRRGRIRPDDFVTEVMLANSPQLADHIMQRVTGRLDAEDPSGTLSQTLQCLAAHGFDRTTAAAALPTHRNTLLYRINRIEKLSGLDLGQHAHRELARLAVIWMETKKGLGAAGEPGLSDRA
jgi:PucR C-terminal helix-turn-helix domain